MISMTPDSILAFMKKSQYDAEIQTETQQVFTLFKIEKKEYPLFLRIFDEGHLLQLLVFIPSLLVANEHYGSPKSSQQPSKANKPEVIADIARLLHLLNKELDVPGFGIDEMAGVVFYRLMLPTPKKQIDSELLGAFLKTTEHVCKMFSPPIEAVSSGQITLDELLIKASKKEK